LSRVESLDDPRVRGISPVEKEKVYGGKDLLKRQVPRAYSYIHRYFTGLEQRYDSKLLTSEERHRWLLISYSYCTLQLRQNLEKN